jgi:hypothetical protein
MGIPDKKTLQKSLRITQCPIRIKGHKNTENNPNSNNKTLQPISVLRSKRNVLVHDWWKQ